MLARSGEDRPSTACGLNLNGLSATPAARVGMSLIADAINRIIPSTGELHGLVTQPFPARRLYTTSSVICGEVLNYCNGFLRHS